MKSLTVLFWILAVPTGGIALLVMLMTMAGKKLSSATPLWLSMVAALAVLALLAWAWRLSGVHHQPGWACVITVASWLVFAVTMIVNGLLRQTSWN